MKTNKDHFSDLATYMLDNRLALFVGAGFSYNFGYPSWGILLKNIIEKYEIKDKLVQTSLFPFINEDDIDGDEEEVNEVILEKLLGVDYLRLAGYIDSILENDFGKSIHTEVAEVIKSSRMHRKTDGVVKDLASFLSHNKEYLEDIITTNYDDNIEFCLDYNASVIHRDISSINKIEHRNKVYKIHGCASDEIQEPDIIITEKDYNNFIAKNKYLFYKVYSFFTEKKIVFIGYSINDPNIRSILNDVIEENKDKVNLEMYWVTRDKLKDLDRQYYQQHFNLNIIEECEINEFFEELQTNVNTQIDLRSLKGADLAEYVKGYKNNYTKAGFIKDIIDTGKEDEVLKAMFDKVNADEYAYERNLEPYLALISALGAKDFARHKMSLQKLIDSGKKRQLYKIIDYAYKSDDFIDALRNSDMVEDLLGVFLERANGSHEFGDYAKTIEHLLKAFDAFSKEMDVFEEDFLRALQYCIRFSCYNGNRRSGEDYGGLDRLSEYAKLLDEVMLEKLASSMTSMYMGEREFEKVECLIDNSDFSDKEKIPARFKYSYKKYLMENLFDSMRSILKAVTDSKETNYLYTVGDTEILIEIEDEEINLINNQSRVLLYNVKLYATSKKVFIEADEKHEITKLKELMFFPQQIVGWLNEEVEAVIDNLKETQ
ncbi:MAG: hypothetical protein CVU95_13860 [Firmicutes bacterium HGW-Firmicutes-2]|jgi:hypothetical protein|nr:MAG: hypothetical protein CVU95_13860 [Firmicutes bacterium HGW-Firmicutes-2]